MYCSGPRSAGNSKCWQATTPRKREQRLRSRIAFALAALVSAGCTPHNGDAGILSVSVAASLQNSMTELAPVFEQSQLGMKLRFNFGGSGTLQQQIERGAPADVFFSAAPKPMDALAGKGLIVASTRR